MWASDQEDRPGEQWTSVDIVTRPGDMLALSRAIKDGTGLSGVVTILRRITNGPAAFVDLRGSLLASAPSRARWPVDELASWSLGDPTVGATPCAVFPVTLAGDVEALLLVSDATSHAEACELAAELAALEMARLQATLSGRRELVSQILEDVLAGHSRGPEARIRLASIGIALSASETNSVIVGRCDLPASQLRMRPWNLHSLLNGSGDPYVRATVDGAIVLIVPSSGSITTIAAVLLQHLKTFDPNASVGVGPAASDVTSFIMSYLQAREAARDGGVQQARPLNLGYLLLGSADKLPLEELSTKALEPVVNHDGQNRGELLRTLITYLAMDCSVSRTSKALFIHRNTLRYRLGVILDLTGWSVDTFEGRLHFWIATRALESSNRMFEAHVEGGSSGRDI